MALLLDILTHEDALLLESMELQSGLGKVSVIYTEVSALQRCPLREVPLYKSIVQWGCIRDFRKIR